MRRGRWIALAGCAALIAGCGGDEKARQDADEPEGEWAIDVVEAKFPRSQHLAEATTMRIRVRNTADRAVPNIAVTVDGLSSRSEQAGLADAERPNWVVDDAPRGGVTAYTNTWALGRLAPGETKTFEWKVTPVKAGRYELTYRVAAGLDGKARAVATGGERPEGKFAVNVSREPAQSRVDPETGDVIRD
jgi:hypothetical protein